MYIYIYIYIYIYTYIYMGNFDLVLLNKPTLYPLVL